MSIFRKCGLDLPSLNAMGVGPVTIKAEYEYKSELYYGDTVQVDSFVTLHSPFRATFTHEITKAGTGEIVCLATILGVWINLNTKKPHQFPDEIYERLLGRGAKNSLDPS